MADAGFDTRLCTQALEHVAEHQVVIGESARVLVTGEVLLATVPFTFEEHEIPNDYFLFTSSGIRHLPVTAGWL